MRLFLRELIGLGFQLCERVLWLDAKWGTCWCFGLVPNASCFPYLENYKNALFTIKGQARMIHFWHCVFWFLFARHSTWTLYDCVSTSTTFLICVPNIHLKGGFAFKKNASAYRRSQLTGKHGVPLTVTNHQCNISKTHRKNNHLNSKGQYRKNVRWSVN